MDICDNACCRDIIQKDRRIGNGELESNWGGAFTSSRTWNTSVSASPKVVANDWLPAVFVSTPLS